MNYKRAFLIGIVLFAASLAIDGFYGHLMGVDLAATLPADLPNEMWFVAVASSAMLAIIGAFWYSAPYKIKDGFINGLKFGVILSIICIFLDVVALGFQVNGINILAGYFVQFYFWLAFIMIIAVSGLVGFVKIAIAKYEL